MIWALFLHDCYTLILKRIIKQTSVLIDEAIVSEALKSKAIARDYAFGQHRQALTQPVDQPNEPARLVSCLALKADVKSNNIPNHISNSHGQKYRWSCPSIAATKPHASSPGCDRTVISPHVPSVLRKSPVLLPKVPSCWVFRRPLY